MILKKVIKKETVNKCRFSGIMERSDGRTSELFLKYPLAYKDFLNVSSDPFFPVLLIPIMEKGEELEIVHRI